VARCAGYGSAGCVAVEGEPSEPQLQLVVAVAIEVACLTVSATDSTSCFALGRSVTVLVSGAGSVALEG